MGRYGGQKRRATTSKLYAMDKDYDNAGDCQIYLSNDNGYTYGHINTDTMNLGTYTEDNGVEIEERW